MKITIKFETQMATVDEPFWSIVATCYCDNKQIVECPYYVATGSQDEIEGDYIVTSFLRANDTAINDAKPKVLAWAKEQWPDAEIEFE